MAKIKYLLLIVIAVGAGLLTYWLNSQTQTPPITATTSPTPQTQYPPTAIRIAKLYLNLPVQAAVVHDNHWDLFDTSVSWLSTSSVPGQGNVILYAHNRKQLFGNLYQLKPGDVIEVQQQDHWLTYKVDISRSVTAKDIDAVLSTDNRLTLYTCDGSFDQKRLVVYASPLHSSTQ